MVSDLEQYLKSSTKKTHSSFRFPPNVNVLYLLISSLLFQPPKQGQENILLQKHSTIIKLRKSTPI